MEEYLASRNQVSNHAVFFGCSFTFGDGLMYSSTFPYLFEKLNPDYKSYNYGASGFSPQQIALLFDKQVNIINSETVPEKKGFALYTYINDHLNRVYGGSRFLRWGYLVPDMYIENDSLIIKKWSKTRLLCSKVFKDVNLLSNFDINFCYPHKKSFYERFAGIINYTAKKYWEPFPDNHFYVSIYPGQDKDLNWTQYLDNKIVILKVDTPADYNDKRKYEVSQLDHHPSKVSNVYYVEELTRLIKGYE